VIGHSKLVTRLFQETEGRELKTLVARFRFVFRREFFVILEFLLLRLATHLGRYRPEKWSPAQQKWYGVIPVTFLLVHFHVGAIIRKAIQITCPSRLCSKKIAQTTYLFSAAFEVYVEKRKQNDCRHVVVAGLLVMLMSTWLTWSPTGEF